FLPDFMQEDPTARKRFLREAKSAAALDHPFICKIYEVGEAEGRDFISMEYVQGVTLKEKLAKGPLALKDALQKATEIAEALEAAHKQNIVHRDLKPSNIMLMPEGHVKVMDFGLAKQLIPAEGIGSGEETLSASLTKTGTTLGTLAYMSPEQLRGEEVDTRSDVFSFGVVLYEMITGAHPFRKHQQMETASAILRDDPSPLSEYVAELPEGLEQTVEKMLAKQADDRHESAREVRVDLEQPVGAVPFIPARRRLTLDVGRWRDWLARFVRVSSAPRIQSLAVLPLDNLMGDAGQEYFVDGMHEALITDLSRIGALKVISRRSVMRYKETDKSIPQIARELGVDAVIEGSVLRAGDRVRITAQLIHGTTDEHLWAESYARDLHDVLTLQAEVARAIAQEIQVAVTPEETRRLASAHPVNPEAYEAYLKGRFHWYKLSPEHFDAALEYFQLALEKDPNYALAHQGIADIWLSRGDSGIVSPREAFPKAKTALLKAMELDDTLAEVHVSLANLRFIYEWDWGGAETEFQRAIQLNPNYADVRLFYSDFLISMRRPEEAMAEIERALELDPFNFFFQCFFGWHLVYLRRYDDAIARLRKTLRTEPNFSSAHLGLWGAFYQKRMYEEALAEAKKFFAVLGESEVAEALAHGYAESGYPGAMSLAAEKLAAPSNLTYVPAIRIARLYAHAEEREQALEWLEKAYEQRETPLVHLSVGWDWDPLRSDPRFQDLLRRMGLEP
ncbi:protein kinase, partial [Acidobacteria bacterium AH-259-O06]|nr:protein kinase [Acidobacteria bacterium AH-259-O06]